MPSDVALSGVARSRFAPIETSSALACASLAGAANAGETRARRGTAAVAASAPSDWRRVNIGCVKFRLQWCGAASLPRAAAKVNCLARRPRLPNLRMASEAESRAESEGRCADERLLDVDAERKAYRADGYVLLKHLFPPLVLAMFRGRLQQDLDLTGTRTFVRGNNLLTKPAIEVYSLEYPPMAAFHWGLTARVMKVAGCELMPSYAYFRIYQQGDVCRVHSDRPACEHSLSLTVELGDNIPWALSMEK